MSVSVSECEADFTKLSIGVKEPVTSDSNDDKSLYNKMATSNKLDICFKKCENNSRPMIMFDNNISYSIGNALKKLEEVVCLSEPSSNKEINPSMLPTDKDYATKGIRKLTYNCEQGEYVPKMRKCAYIPDYYIPKISVSAKP